MSKAARICIDLDIKENAAVELTLHQYQVEHLSKAGVKSLSEMVAAAQLAKSEPHGHVRCPRPARRAEGRLPGGVSCVRCGIHAAGGVSPGVDIPPLPCREAAGEVAVCGRL